MINRKKTPLLNLILSLIHRKRTHPANGNEMMHTPYLLHTCSTVSPLKGTSEGRNSGAGMEQVWSRYDSGAKHILLISSLPIPPFRFISYLCRFLKKELFI